MNIREDRYERLLQQAKAYNAMQARVRLCGAVFGGIGAISLLIYTFGSHSQLAGFIALAFLLLCVVWQMVSLLDGVARERRLEDVPARTYIL